MQFKACNGNIHVMQSTYYNELAAYLWHVNKNTLL